MLLLLPEPRTGDESNNREAIRRARVSGRGIEGFHKRKPTRWLLRSHYTEESIHGRPQSTWAIGEGVFSVNQRDQNGSQSSLDESEDVVVSNSQ